ncbi:MAG: Bug family tripartite tricarboxylate transporter substrate binding protein [Advenella sp.]
MKRFTILVCLVLGTLAGVSSVAQTFPNRPVRLIVPFPPGGGTDILARPVAEALSKKWGQPVVVENKGGAGGSIGTDVAAKAAPDGYTLVLGTVGTHAINQSLYRKLPYDGVRDFDTITLMANTPNILVVNPNVAAKSVQELISFAKTHPGKLNYASPGNGTPPHLGAEMFKKLADVSITHVPYKGTGPALTDLMGGTVDLMIGNAPAVLPYVKSKKLRALASTSETRPGILPGLPTLSESGLKGYEADTWYGIFTAKGTPIETVNKLNADLVAVLNSDKIRSFFAEQGAEVIANSPQAASQKVRADAQKWKTVIDDLNLKLD